MPYRLSAAEPQQRCVYPRYGVCGAHETGPLYVPVKSLGWNRFKSRALSSSHVLGWKGARFT